MPWPIHDVNIIRREFVTKALMQGVTFSALCREYGISRKTGYKWKQRALAEGLRRLSEQSRRPKSSPTQLAESAVCALIRFKLRHPAWGPKKIRQLYARRYADAPSLSSCQRVLTRAGLVLRRRRRRAAAAQRISTPVIAQSPNEVWTVDFKGWWSLSNGQRCEPLTVRDAFSRYVLAVHALPRADTTQVQGFFAGLFQQYGLPRVIKSDNGAPFATVSAPLGLSRLSAWWLALGIGLDRSRPAHPQDNGAHERLHRDIAAELSCQNHPDLASQQAAFDLWREEFNWQRPHEALQGRCPAEVYRKSSRRMPAAVSIEYGPEMITRKVSQAGMIKWGGHVKIFLSGALSRWPIGLRQCDADHLEVWFTNLLLGHIEISSVRFLRTPSRSQEAPLIRSA
jgi:transposase InsO family protein